MIIFVEIDIECWGVISIILDLFSTLASSKVKNSRIRNKAIIHHVSM